MKKRTQWIIVFATLILSLGSAACEGCGGEPVFVGDALVNEADIVEQAEERDDSTESGDPQSEEPAADTPADILEADEIEDEGTGREVVTCDATTWSRVYETSNSISQFLDHSVKETFDGGYVVEGGSIEFPEGGHDARVLKLDCSGNVMWENTYGQNGYDGYPLEYIRSLCLTQDWRYVGGGEWGASSWIVKLVEDGGIVWLKTYQRERGWGATISTIEGVRGGGFVACGYIEREGGHGMVYDTFYLLHVDEAGNVLWSKEFDESAAFLSSCRAVKQMPGGDLIVTGRIELPGAGNYDIFIQRLGIDGTVVWQKRYRRETYDETVGLQLVSDGGTVLAAYSTLPGEEEGDAWFLKLDADGAVVIQESVGGEMDDRPHSIAPAGEDGYILCGDTFSFGAGERDCWLVRLDSEGNVLWQKSYGGEQDDGCDGVQPTADGGFVVSGATDFFGEESLWVMKLDANGIISESCPPGLGVDTAAVVGETFAEVEDISVPVVDWEVVAYDQAVVPAGSTSSVETQCEP